MIKSTNSRTYEAEINQSVPCWSRFEVDSASVDSSFLRFDSINDESCGRSLQIKVSSVSELKLVTPARSLIPGLVPRIVTKYLVEIL